MIQLSLFKEDWTPETIIELNKVHRCCPNCGHEEWIRASTIAFFVHDTCQLVFGSNYDFCTRCDNMWV